MRKFVYHGTNHRDFSLIYQEGLVPQEPHWSDNWPGFDERGSRLYAFKKCSLAKQYVNWPEEGVVLRIVNDDKWHTGKTDYQFLWRATPISRDQIEVLLGNGKWCPLLNYKPDINI